MSARLVPAVLLTAAVAVASVAAQPSSQQTPPFRTEAALVTVDVVVTDDRGEPVTDLKASDFAVTEEGHPEVVQFFQPVMTGARPEAPTRPAGVGASSARVFPYSTNVGTVARPGRSLVLFFDDVNLTEEQGIRARDALGRFLADEARSGDVVSIVAPQRGLRWHARLPEGREPLMKVVAGLRGARSPEVAQEQLSDYEAYRIHVMQDEQVAERVGRRFNNYRVFGREPADLSRDQGPRPQNKGGTAGLIEPLVQTRAAEAYARAAARMRVTLASLVQTIDALGPVRGRKSIVVLSPGFIEDQELVLLRQVEDAARRANVAIYFVDARGLEVQSGFASAQFGSPIDARDVGATNADLALDAEGAAALADASGGFAVRNRNDLAAGLRRIGREAEAYYLLGYAPADRRQDGRFRRITVRVSRPGVRVRARRGYYAGGVRAVDSGTAGKNAAGRDSAGEKEDALETVLRSPYDMSDVPVRAATYVFGNVRPGVASVLLAVEADLRSFQLKPGGGKLTDVLEMRALVTSLAGGDATRYDRSVEMALDGRVPRGDTSAWYPVSQAFELPPGQYQVRVVVRDRNGGRAGSVTHDFEVPARTGTSLSSVILTDTILSPPAGSGAAPKPVLIVRREIEQGATLYYQYSVFDAATDAKGATSVRAGHVVRRRGGAVVKEMNPTPLAPGPSGLSRFAGISLPQASPGEYELVITVIDDVRGQTLTVTEPFAIVSPGATRP